MLSLAYSQEIEILNANETDASIVDLAGSSFHALTFASCDRNANVRIWKRSKDTSVLIGIVSFPSTIVSFAGSCFILLAGKDSTLRRVDISNTLLRCETSDVPVNHTVRRANFFCLISDITTKGR